MINPTLPTNIVRLMMIFPAVFNWEVKSRLRPTVLIADVTSNQIWVTDPSGPQKATRQVAVPIHRIDNNMIA